MGEGYRGTLVAGQAKLILLSVQKCSQWMITSEISSPAGTLAMLFKQDHYATSAEGASEVGKHPFVFSVCPTNQSQPHASTLWITLMTEVSNLEYVLYLSDDPTEWGSFLLPISSLGSYAGRDIIDGSLQVACPGESFPCFHGADTFTSCLETWNPLPRKDGNFLWPIPRLFTDSLTEKVLYEDPDDSNPLFGNELRATLVLESYYKAQSIVPFSEWEQSLEQCVLTFPTLSWLQTKNNEVLFLPFFSTPMIS